MKSRNLFLSLAVALALAPCARPVPHLSRVYNFTVPELHHHIWGIDFKDLDSDGWPEVLVADPATLVLYSLADSTVLYRLDLDSTLAEFGLPSFSECSMQRRLVLGDVNRDSLPDAVMLAAVFRGCWTSSSGALVLFVDNILAAEPEVSVIDLGWPSEGKIGILESRDLNSDGYGELILSADSADLSYDPVCLYAYTHGRTRMYYSFPDSIMHSYRRYLVDDMPLELDNGSEVTVAIQDSSRARYCYGEASITNEFKKYLLLDGNGAVLSQLRIVEPDHCTGDADNMVYDQVWARCAGNIDDRDPAPEILSTHVWSQTCFDTAFGVPIKIYDDGYCEILLHRVTETGALQEVWRVESNSCPYRRFFYHPGYPGTCFGTTDFVSTIYQYDGRSGDLIGPCGSLSDSEDPLFLGRPFGDNDPLDSGGPNYLVTLDSTVVAFYSLIESTHVDDTENSSSLPTTFTIRQPYPNPFNPTVTVPITLPTVGRLRVQVFNVLGQPVGVLYDGKAGPGDIKVEWDGTDFSSGVYFFKVVFNDLPNTVSAVLVK